MNQKRQKGIIPLGKIEIVNYRQTDRQIDKQTE